MRNLRLSSIALICIAAACSSDPNGSVVIVTGDQADVFTRAPAATHLLTEIVALDGTKTTLSTTTLPESSVDIGSKNQDDIGAVAITGLDANNQTVVKGESLLVQWGALSAQNLLIFAQRVKELAHVPSGPAAFDPPQTIVVEGRFIFETNGTSTQLYDLFGLSTLSAPTLPRAAKSIAEYGSSALLIDENGATGFDLETGDTTDITAPANGTFAEVAGGAHIAASDSSQYVVGATRIGGAGASVRVLTIDANGTPGFAAISTPRQGACAAFVSGRGLVVYGGAAAPNAGAEILVTGQTLATPTAFPSDPVQGCALTGLDTTHILEVGTDGGPAKVFDLTCNANCTPVLWSGNLPVVNAEVADLSPTAVLVVGNDTAGNSHVYRAAAPNDPTPGVTEIPLKDPRKNAHLLRGPAEALYVVGGGLAGIESYRE